MLLFVMCVMQSQLQIVPTLNSVRVVRVIKKGGYERFLCRIQQKNAQWQQPFFRSMYSSGNIIASKYSHLNELFIANL